MKKILLAGSFPFVAVAVLCAAFFALGQRYTTTPTRIAVAEKGAIILETLLDHQELPRDELDALLTTPIKTVLKKYQDMGYLVIDISKNEQGAMAVTTLPSDVIDITEDLRTAVAKASPATPPSNGPK